MKTIYAQAYALKIDRKSEMLIIIVHGIAEKLPDTVFPLTIDLRFDVMCSETFGCKAAVFIR